MAQGTVLKADGHWLLHPQRDSFAEFRRRQCSCRLHYQLKDALVK